MPSCLAVEHKHTSRPTLLVLCISESRASILIKLAHFLEIDPMYMHTKFERSRSTQSRCIFTTCYAVSLPLFAAILAAQGAACLYLTFLRPPTTVRWRNWLARLTVNQKVACSSPDQVSTFCKFHLFYKQGSDRNMLVTLLFLDGFG